MSGRNMCVRLLVASTVFTNTHLTIKVGCHKPLRHEQAVVDLGNGTIKCSIQGGWKPESSASDANDCHKQLQLAMEDVNTALKVSGQ
jgi:hypothetical protein